MRVLEDMQIIRELGHTPILACRKESWLFEEAKRREFEVYAVPFGHLANPKPYLAMFQLIRRKNIDIVHTHSSKDSYPATYAAKLLGKKVVRSRHIELTKKPGHLFRLADAIVTTGEIIRQELISFAIEPEKIVSIPTCPNSRLFHPTAERRTNFRKAHAIGDDAMVIGTMAGAGQRKRGWALVEMMEEIVNRNPKSLLLIAGDSRGDAAEKLETSIRERGLTNHVKFIGYVAPEEFLDAIDIYACPSEKEGLPQALMQAMMMGKACLSTNVGSISELNTEENLLLVDKEDLSGFAKLMSALVSDEERVKKLGRKNREIAMKNFNYDVMKRKTETLYNTLAAKETNKNSFGNSDA